MSCEPWRISLSARLDGEKFDHLPIELDEHLAGCVECQTWLDHSTALYRSVRLQSLKLHVDRTDEILAQVPLTSRPRPVREGVRWLLLVTGLLQMALAVPSLLLSGFDAPVHLTREMGAFELALGVAMIAAWHRPRLASGMIPFAASLAATIVVTSAFDVIRHEMAALPEIHHVIDLVAVALLLSVQGRVRSRSTPAPALSS